MFFLTKTVEIRWNWRCKIFNLKIRWCKILDKFHVWVWLCLWQCFSSHCLLRLMTTRIYREQRTMMMIVMTRGKHKHSCLRPIWVNSEEGQSSAKGSQSRRMSTFLLISSILSSKRSGGATRESHHVFNRIVQMGPPRVTSCFSIVEFRWSPPVSHVTFFHRKCDRI